VPNRLARRGLGAHLIVSRFALQAMLDRATGGPKLDLEV
jgi:hypothetical protein